MNTTRYFNLRMTERPDITVEMCERVVVAPVAEQLQGNGYWQLWGFIEERGHYLRVITTEDRSALHNAFWDNAFKRRNR